MNGAVPLIALEHGRKTISAYDRPSIDEVENETMGGGGDAAPGQEGGLTMAAAAQRATRDCPAAGSEPLVREAAARRSTACRCSATPWRPPPAPGPTASAPCRRRRASSPSKRCGETRSSRLFGSGEDGRPSSPSLQAPAWDDAVALAVRPPLVSTVVEALFGGAGEEDEVAPTAGRPVAGRDAHRRGDGRAGCRRPDGRLRATSCRRPSSSTASAQARPALPRQARPPVLVATPSSCRPRADRSSSTS